MRAVIGALELGDLAPPREGARRPHRVHGRLGAGVGEAHHLHARNPRGQDPRELDLVLARPREGHAAGGLLRDRLDHGGMRVAQDQARVVAVEVEALGAVGVPDARALPARDVEGIGVEEGRGPAVAARHHAQRLLVHLPRAGRLGLVVVDDGLERHERHSFQRLPRGKGDGIVELSPVRAQELVGLAHRHPLERQPLAGLDLPHPADVERAYRADLRIATR